MFEYEKLTLAQLYAERRRLRSVSCDNKETRITEIDWQISEKGGEIVSEYHVEFTGTIDISGIGAKEVLQQLKQDVFSNSNVDIESIIISRK